MVDKDSGREVATASGDAAFAFHHVNAFEDRDGLAIDMVTYPDAAIIDELYLARLRGGTPITATGELTRLSVKLGGETRVTRRALAATALELPRINYESRAGKPYRYAWGTSIQVCGDFLDSIVKIDIETGDVMRWYEKGVYPGEPVFVPDSAARAEDDGVLLSLILDIAKDRSSLLVLDAATLAEKARAQAPHAIPFHFHGNYFSRAPGKA